MNYSNQMQEKIISTLRGIVDEWELEWVEINQGPNQGIVRLLEAGRFPTLLKIEYEFQPQRYRLLIYREGKHIGGRCSIDYDDGILIEQIIVDFRRLCGDGHPSMTDCDAIATPPTSPRSNGRASRQISHELLSAFRIGG